MHLATYTYLKCLFKCICHASKDEVTHALIGKMQALQVFRHLEFSNLMWVES